jgi:dCMP deaminase
MGFRHHSSDGRTIIGEQSSHSHGVQLFIIVFWTRRHGASNVLEARCAIILGECHLAWGGSARHDTLVAHMMHPQDMQFCVDVVRRLSRNSRATRAKVACVIWDASRRTIVSLGYNGTPEGEDNQMEHDNKTLPTVVHAERNALRKLPWWNFLNRSRFIMFITHAPCHECAKALVRHQIRKVYYLDNYGSSAGLEHLRMMRVDVKRLLVP